MDWVRLPSERINNGWLKDLRWERGRGADNVSALMVLIAIAHLADQDTGQAFATYEAIAKATHLSRAKISAGLDVLERQDVIARNVDGRSTYQLIDFDLGGGWSKLPAKRMYTSGITALKDFTLRRSAELNAMKLYLLFVARRDNGSNLTNISYDKITAYSGIDRSKIKQALSVLVLAGLVHVERMPSDISDYGVSNAYRLSHLNPHTHMGTRGRAMIEVARNDIF